MTTPDPFAAPGPESPQQPWTGSGYGAAPQGPPASYGPPPQPGQYPPGFGYPAPKTDGTAIAVLVLAVCSFVVFPIVPAIIALVLAPGAMRTIEASGGRLTGEGLVRAGRITAWIHLALSLGVLLLVVLFFGAFGLAAL